MDIAQLGQSLAEALAASADLSDWALANCGRGHKVFWGIDPQNPPRETDCPCLVLLPGGKDLGEGRAPQLVDFLLTAALLDVGAEISADYDNLIEYVSIAKLDAFRLWAISAVNAALPAGLLFARLEVEYDFDESPIIQAACRISLEESACIGGDYLG